jgi:hypothetical protein
MKTSNKLLITAGAVILVLIFSSIVISRSTVDELLHSQQINVSAKSESSNIG